MNATSELHAALIPQDQVSILVDPQAYADGRIFETYRWLRKHKPLGLAVAEGFDPFWVVTRAEDIRYISRHNDLFHSGDTQFSFMDRASDQRIREITGGSPHLVHSLVSMDPPEHMKYRVLTQGYFMPKSLRKLEAQIRDIACEFVEKMLSTGGECDFLTEVALNYPLRVIMSIFGVPIEDEAIMLKLTQELFGAQDPDVSGAADVLSAEAQAEYLARTVEGFHEYFRTLSDARRDNPRDDLSSVIANAKVDGQPISEQAEMGYYITVATAGHDTTSTSTAIAMAQLARHPHEFQKVKSDPSLIPGLVDEAIRWATPIKSFMRSAAEDIDVSGQRLSKGDWIMLCYGSGNRDESVFDAPDSFRVDRSPNPYISFGHGPHICLGMHLAKLEMRILFEELLPRLKSVELNGHLKMIPSLFISGPKALPIRFALE